MSRKPAKSRSGTTLTQEERRERGLRVVVSVTLPAETIERLDEMAADDGLTRSEAVEAVVEECYRRRT